MKSEIRSAWIKLRVSPAEKEAIVAKAEAQGQSLTDFLRQRALDYRLRLTPVEKERVWQLARIGSNLNQLARWANTHKRRADALDVLLALVSLEREAKAMSEDASGLCSERTQGAAGGKALRCAFGEDTCT